MISVEIIWIIVYNIYTISADYNNKMALYVKVNSADLLRDTDIVGDMVIY